MSRITVEPIRILLVEDDEADVILTQRALEKANVWNQVDVVRNGQEALDYLRNERDFKDKIRFPGAGLILLDLNLPGLDGRELLDILYKDPKLKAIPVVIVSTSDYEKDVEFGRARGVQHYIIKPLQIDNMMATFTSLPTFRIILGNVAS